MRIAGFSESSKLWTHIALPGYSWEYVCISVCSNCCLFLGCKILKFVQKLRRLVISFWLLLDCGIRVPLNKRGLYLLLRSCDRPANGRCVLCCVGGLLADTNRWTADLRYVKLSGSTKAYWWAVCVCYWLLTSARDLRLLLDCCSIFAVAAFGDRRSKCLGTSAFASTRCCDCISIGPDIRQDYPLNLSI